MLNQKQLNKLIFVDIETVPQHKSFFDMTDTKQSIVLKKFKDEVEKLLNIPMDEWDIKQIQEDEKTRAKIEKLYNNRAPIFAELNKIVCISIGFFDEKTSIEPLSAAPLTFTTEHFADHDEVKLLTNFHAALKSVLDKTFNHERAMVAFSGKVFDFPVIAKRMILNKMVLPPFLDISNLKPWEINHMIDPAEVWQLGAWNARASLALLCDCFGVPSSKDDIDGSQVRGVYYEENDLNRIAVYCDKDVFSLAVLYLRMKGIFNEVNHISS